MALRRAAIAAARGSAAVRVTPFAAVGTHPALAGVIRGSFAQSYLRRPFSAESSGGDAAAPGAAAPGSSADAVAAASTDAAVATPVEKDPSKKWMEPANMIPREVRRDSMCELQVMQLSHLGVLLSGADAVADVSPARVSDCGDAVLMSAGRRLSSGQLRAAGAVPCCGPQCMAFRHSGL